jgi:indole-3-glycerol phosphate synthase
MSDDFLEQMAASSRDRVQNARRARSEANLLELAQALPAAPPLQLNPAGFDLIAELKLRSPAIGQLKAGDEDVEARVIAYAFAGAAAVSVLTEPSRFDGSMDHLEKAARTLNPFRVPAMRKDFIVDPYQIIEARAAGAGGVLVILRMLPPSEIQALMDCARSLGLFVLLEAFDEHDIGQMHDLVSGPARPTVLVGVNCRDLATLQVVPKRLEQLAPLLPNTVARVAESGVATAEDARRVSAAGYDLALVGSALMQGGNPRVLASAMLDAGRAVRQTQAMT